MNLKIEESFEDSVASFLGGISGFTIFKGFDDNQFITPRLEIEVSSLNFLDTLDSVGLVLPEYSKFDLTLSVRVITNADDGTSRSEHNSGVSSVRELFLRSADSFDTSNLPNHNVSYIRMDSSTQMISGSARVTQTDYIIRASCI